MKAVNLKMKRVLCIAFCALGLISLGYWTFEYIHSYGKSELPSYISTFILLNFIFVVTAIVIGVGVIKISINQWFPGDDDVLSIKDRVLIFAVIIISAICGGLFVFTIIDSNVNSIPATEYDNMRLRMLLFIMANTYVSYAYYQHFRVVRLPE